ncbi:hypothetical protein [Chryseosolibacter indicus]|uniref:Uncharacterized protein n=1 Tax=Chryseosolibacter indicus TaxID=2782351 RepID=A0ABS5VNY8_9BACT|nr:hypothetical protein [Chryseosolibacter indicus]MBT1701716.1 hypothetical protein [Chryseosolibacter indicus]
MAIETVKEEIKKSGEKNVVINRAIKSRANDPFFVKKAKEAEAFLEQHGLPQAYVK